MSMYIVYGMNNIIVGLFDCDGAPGLILSFLDTTQPMTVVIGTVGQIVYLQRAAGLGLTEAGVRVSASILPTQIA